MKFIIERSVIIDPDLNEYYWVLKSDNEEVLFVSEMVPSAQECKDAIDKLIKTISPKEPVKIPVIDTTI